MKNKSILISMLLLYSSIFSQTQYGFLLEANSTNINSENLINVKSKIGYGIGFTILYSLHKSADFLVEITYAKRFIQIDKFKDFNNQEVEFPNKNFNSEDCNLNLIYNQYLIIPDLQKLNLSLQVGYGMSLSNDWTFKDNTILFGRGDTINSIILTGISTGTEKLRFSLRYNIELTNILRGIHVNGIPDLNNNNGQRVFDGKQKDITFSITYLLDNFNF